MEKMNLHKAFDEALAEAVKVNNNIVVLENNQNAASLAAKLASEGKIPFITTNAAFTVGCAYDQIRSSIAIPRANVKIVNLICGHSDFADGRTQQFSEDSNIMRAMPEMIVLNPADAVELKKMIPRIIEYQGPVYLRVSQGDLPVYTSAKDNFEIGKINPLLDGRDVVIFASGIMVSKVMEAAEELKSDGIYARVFNVSTLKPLVPEEVLKYAHGKKAVICAEESVKTGGLGQAIASIILGKGHCTFGQIAINDVFETSATDYEEFLVRSGLSADDIYKTVKRVFNKKYLLLDISVSKSEQNAIDKALVVTQKITALFSGNKKNRDNS